MTHKNLTTFSEDSDVTVVLTSCGRFDLLKKTVESFLQFNSYPIKAFIITEDSGSEEVFSSIPEALRDKFTFLINKENIGQIKSIDNAYAKVDTPYIFHCEDDWEFYRSSFIEDSKKILESNKEIIQVWLRSYYYDIRIHSGYHYWGERLKQNDVAYYRVMSHKQDWQGFSFNPGLRRLNDYLNIGKYDDYDHEKSLSKLYSDNGMWAATLEADAVSHLGFDNHVVDVRERDKKTKRARKKALQNCLLISITLFVGYFIGITSAN